MRLPPILYVEDDENDIFFMQVACQKAAIANPLIALRDGKQAMDYLAGEAAFVNREQNPLPCLVLLDLNIPIKSGLEVLQWLREQPAFKDLNVVIVSSSSQQSDIDQARKIGIQDYIVKPSNPPQLVEIVRRLEQRWLT